MINAWEKLRKLLLEIKNDLEFSNFGFIARIILQEKGSDFFLPFPHSTFSGAFPSRACRGTLYFSLFTLHFTPGALDFSL